MTNPVLTWSIIAVYLAFMLAMGIAFRRFNTNTADYFRGGSRGTWWLVGVSILATSVSARSFTANAGSAFEAGYSILVPYLATCAALVIQVWFLAPWMRQMRATTFAEIVRDRFDARTQQFYVWAKVLFFFIGAAIWLWGVATFIASVFHYPIAFVIVAVGLVALVISAAGGTMAVMASDVVQALIMLGMATLLTVLCLVELGGVGGLMKRLAAPELANVFTVAKPAGAFPGDQYTSAWLWALFVMMIVIQSSMEFAVRYFAVKDSASARRAALLATVLLFAVIPVFFVPAWTARLLYADEVLGFTTLSKPAESAFAVASLHLLPEGMIGLMIVAMLAVTMGTLDAGLNRNAALIVNDALPALMRALGRPMPDQRAQFRIAEIVTILLGLLCIATAIYFSSQKGLGLFEFANDVTALLLLPLALPICAGIFWKRVPPWSALASSVAAMIPSVWAYLAGKFFGAPWTLQQTVWWVLGVGTVTFFATTPWWRSSPRDYHERVDTFFAKMRTPVDFEREIGAATDAHQSRLVGWFCVTATICVLLLLPFVRGPRAHASVLGLAAFLAIPAALLLAHARRAARKASERTAELSNSARECASHRT